VKTALAACPACARHVRLDEPSCPFCRAQLPSSFRQMKEPARPATRLSRAAVYALRVGTLSVSTVACGGSLGTSGNEADGAQVGPASDAAYGVPPMEASAEDDALDMNIGSSSGAYGAPFPIGGFDAAYGGSPIFDEGDDGPDDAASAVDAARDAGATDAQADASFPCGSVGPAYGGFPCLPFPVDASPAADASDAQPLIDAAYGGVPIEPEAGPTDGGAPE
jgi:hypothetical protein